MDGRVSSLRHPHPTNPEPNPVIFYNDLKHLFSFSLTNSDRNNTDARESSLWNSTWALPLSLPVVVGRSAFARRLMLRRLYLRTQVFTQQIPEKGEKHILHFLNSRQSLMVHVSFLYNNMLHLYVCNRHFLSVKLIQIPGRLFCCL